MNKEKAMTMYENMLPSLDKVKPKGSLEYMEFKNYREVIKHFITYKNVSKFSGGGYRRTARDIWALCKFYFPKTKYHKVLKFLMVNYTGWYCTTINRRVWHPYSDGKIARPVANRTYTAHMENQLKAFKELDL